MGKSKIMDGGSAFNANLARNIAGYAYAYHVTEAKLKAHEQFVKSHNNIKVCDVCRVPLDTALDTHVCNERHNNPHFICNKTIACGRPWCLLEYVRGCSVCTRKNVCNAPCVVCGVLLCKSCSGDCEACVTTTCAEHLFHEFCIPCCASNLFNAKRTIAHYEQRHDGDESFMTCRECDAATDGIASMGDYVKAELERERKRLKK